MAFRFENLEIWKLAIDYGEKIRALTKKFPRSELFGLTSDINRAGISISSNIAEGSGSDSKAEFRRFLRIAVKSLFESVSQLTVARRRKYITAEEYGDMYQNAELLVRKVISFIKSMR
ncbi:MAG: four helix bundle protein [candidate division WOR-3 bacterium]|nr:MAG: four helix bundle protein [candidate division WOR-3 bacterium]